MTTNRNLTTVRYRDFCYASSLYLQRTLKSINLQKSRRAPSREWWLLRCHLRPLRSKVLPYPPPCPPHTSLYLQHMKTMQVTTKGNLLQRLLRLDRRRQRRSEEHTSELQS